MSDTIRYFFAISNSPFPQRIYDTIVELSEWLLLSMLESQLGMTGSKA